MKGTTSGVAVQSAETIVSEIKERIREARESKKMTQAALAKFLGVSRTAVTQWESGLTFPSYEKVIEIARLLFVRPEWIAFGIDTPVEIRTPTETAAVPVLQFGGTLEERVTVATHYIATNYLNDTMRLKADGSVFAYEIETESFAPRFVPGDHIIIDGSVQRINADGLFLIWNGIAAQIVSIASNPTKPGTVSVATTDNGFASEGASL